MNDQKQELTDKNKEIEFMKQAFHKVIATAGEGVCK